MNWGGVWAKRAGCDSRGGNSVSNIDCFVKERRVLGAGFIIFRVGFVPGNAGKRVWTTVVSNGEEGGGAGGLRVEGCGGEDCIRACNSRSTVRDNSGMNLEDGEELNGNRLRKEFQDIGGEAGEVRGMGDTKSERGEVPGREDDDGCGSTTTMGEGGVIKASGERAGVSPK